MRARRPSKITRVVVASVASAVAHALVAAVLVLTPHTPAGSRLAPARMAGGVGQVAPMDPACLVDEALVVGARAAMCLTPWAADRPGCLTRVAGVLDEGLIACRNLARPVDLTMIEAAPLIPGAKALPSEPTELAITEAKAEEEQLRPAGQVVEIAPPAVEQRPDDARFLSEYDSTVEREMKRSGRPEDSAGAASNQPRAPQPSEPSPPSPRPQGDTQGGSGAAGAQQAPGPQAAPGRPGVTGGLASRAPGGQEDGLTPEDGGALPKLGGGGGSPRLAPTPPPGEGGQGGDGRPLSLRDLRPSGAALERVASGSFDALDDVDEGNDTLLNTKRWTYATFFNRVKRAVADNWRPGEIYNLRDPTGKIYGYKDRLTLLKVSLRPDGTLASVIIERASGVDFLDEEAVRAFKAAQPFPNPPGALVERTSNLITFRFGFQFDINDGSSWKVFRYQ